MGFIISLLTVEKPELDASFAGSGVITSLGFLWLVITLSDNSKLQLASSTKCHEFWCQARALMLPVPLVGIMSASKLIHSFSFHLAAFGFQDSSPPDMITLNVANKKNDQNL